MSHPYRIAVQYRPGRGVYEARAPELPGCRAEGTTRSEALARLEEEIAAQVATIEEQGGQAPVPVDAMDEASADGEDSQGDDSELRVRVTASLRREIQYLARAENVPVEALLAELLAEALAVREARALGRRRRRPADQPGRERRQRSRDPGSRSYADIMENKSSFLEYVRTLDQGEPRAGKRRRRRRNRGGRLDSSPDSSPGQNSGPGRDAHDSDSDDT